MKQINLWYNLDKFIPSKIIFDEGESESAKEFKDLQSI